MVGLDSVGPADETESVRIVHVIDTLDPRYGGPPAVAVQLSSAQAALGHEVTLVSHGAAGTPVGQIPKSFAWVPGVNRVKLVTLPKEGGLAGLRLVAGKPMVEEAMRGADVMHMHGVWEPALWVSARVARATGVPYVVRPAGMLDPWSLAQKAFKKRVALMLGFKRMLDESLFLHALNRDERDLVSLMGLKCPVDVVPNGMFMETLADIPPRGTFRAKYPELGDAPFVLFLSRLHYKKGLDHLADAFHSIAARLPGSKLVVAGPDDGARGPFERKIKGYGLTDRVLLPGPLFAADKMAALTDATVFCLPSRQEGFSVAVVEALAVGLPAVVSEDCHFPEVETSGSGRVVPLNGRAVGEALLQLLQNRELREKMSATAKRLVAENYTWPRIAERCLELYERRGRARSALRGTVRVSTAEPDRRPLRVLHVVRSLDPAAGGVPVIALKLATAQAVEGHDVHLLTYATPKAEGDVKAMLRQVPDSDRVERRSLPAESPVETLLGGSAAAVARTVVRGFDVVHMHGMWEMLLVRVAAECRRAGVPYVVTPHGMLDPWSLSQSRWKKKVAFAAAIRTMVDGSAFMHLGNRDERDLIAPLKLRAPYELIPNGVFESEVTDLPPAGTFRAAFPQLGNDPYVLFLSRLHFKKGLDHLAGAFALLAPRLPNVRLVVAGPDGGEKADFERRIAAAGLTDRVHLVGPVYGKMKTAAVTDAACFCLPSRQEGFSMAITEALGAGCACVVSHACHYPEVQESGAGYCTELDPAEIADALEKVLRDPATAREMGARGKALVLSRFTWPVIARLAVEHYRKHGARSLLPHDA